jgi:hypothetical protein
MSHILCRIVSQRRWYYLGLWISLRLAKRSRRRFMAIWDAIYEVALSPINTLLFWVENPRLYLDYRRSLRLLRAGVTEIQL